MSMLTLDGVDVMGERLALEVGILFLLSNACLCLLLLLASCHIYLL